MKPNQKAHAPVHNTPAHGPRSNPGNTEAGIGHTRGQDRPAKAERGRHGESSRENEAHRVVPKR